jgi:TIGR03009 family protein
MTRLWLASFAAAIGLTGGMMPLAAQQTPAGPTAPSRYGPPQQGQAPRTAQPAPGQPTANRQIPAGQSAYQAQTQQGQSQQSQPRQAYGPSTEGAGGPVRQVAGEAPIRQPTPGRTPDNPISIPLSQAAAAAAGAVRPQPPNWAPLDPAHEKWVSDVLRYWEEHSNKIHTLACEFTSWEYDPVNGPKDPITGKEFAKTISKGEIKYAKPDKGLYKVNEMYLAAPPAMGKSEPQYIKQDSSFNIHWISDGERIFEFDGRNKRLIERELPPEMKGKPIADGPLPFLFGARAETIKARYWIRGLPQSGNGKYWLEAVPKSIQDRQNFKAVTIVLDEKTYLPEVIEVLAPNYDVATNPARSTYQFAKHETTDKAPGPLDRFWTLFRKSFDKPSVPSGWTKFIERADGTTVGGPAPGGPNPVGAAPGVSSALEATRPAAPRSQLPR